MPIYRPSDTVGATGVTHIGPRQNVTNRRQNIANHVFYLRGESKTNSDVIRHRFS